MPDIATVSDSREVDTTHSGIRSGKGGIKIISLGHDSEHSASGSCETAVWLPRGPCVEQLMGVVGLMGEMDGITPAGCVGIALCCSDNAGAATR